MTEGSMRFEDALYRIWSFCKMFGCDRGRENDLKGQIDWLKGGILAHQKGCAATLSFGPEFSIALGILSLLIRFLRDEVRPVSTAE